MTGRRGKFAALLVSLRPAQWLKNGLVVAPLIFAFGDPGQGLSSSGALAHAAVKSAIAAISFCLISSSVYLFNDIRDRAADALHPVKRLRPIASGELSVPAASRASAALLGAGMLLAAASGRGFLAIAAAYVALQAAYTLFLKHIALIDVVVIAVGFVMRAVAGALAIKVDISPWLVLCTFSLSLFLALCKRRQEKVVRAESEQRQSLRNCGVGLLNILVSAAAALTVAAYSLYTVSAETISKFGTRRLCATIPFVAFGVSRYLYLVFTGKQGERPEHTLLADGMIAATVLLYLVTFCLLVSFGREP